MLQHRPFLPACLATLCTLFAPSTSAAERTALTPVPVPKSFGALTPLKDHQVVDMAVYPQISHPTAVVAEPGGAVHVFEDRNAARGRLAKQGRIVRLVDEDHDGRADWSTVFVADLDSPRGGCFVGDTLYVLHPPFLSSFRDTDGDGVADERKQLVQGLGFNLEQRGADHTSNDARMGIDGWLYLAIGDYGAKAVGSDGRAVTLLGGGVLRVRPDGSQLELVCEGTRNTFGLAVSPTLEVFARDNTNDGGGWDMRVHHLTPLAHMGYPNLFRNFAEDALPPLVQDGGGAGCGALFLQEPGFPDWINDRFLTISWGKLYTHTLTPHEATFINADQVVWPLSKLLKIDVDGSSRLYAAVYSNGGATSEKPDVGRVVRVVPDGWTHRPFPDLRKMTSGQLLTALQSPSQVLRLNAQREVIGRQDHTIDAALIALTGDGRAPRDTRIAALFALVLRQGEKSRAYLEALLRDATLREYALRALTDDVAMARATSITVLQQALRDSDPRVRQQAVIACARAQVGALAVELLPLGRETRAREPLTTGKPVIRDLIPHTARRALVQLAAVQPCLAALDDANLRPVALAVLRQIHRPEVVAFVIAALERATDDHQRLELLSVLMRLYHRETPWDGSTWWGTRPDTAGPYCQPQTWEQTAVVASALRTHVPRLASAAQALALAEVRRHALPPNELALPITIDPVDSLLAQRSFSATDQDLLMQVAGDAARAHDQRLRAFRGLLDPDPSHYRAWLAKMLDLIARITVADQRLGQEFSDVFVQAPVHRAGLQPLFLRDHLTVRPRSGPVGEHRVLLMATLSFTVHDSPLTTPEIRKRIAQTLDEAPLSVSLVQAIGRQRATAFAKRVDEGLRSPDAALVTAAKQAQQELAQGRATGDLAKTVAALSYEQIHAATMTISGDPELGRQLFMRQACIACHTLTTTEPQRGPYLGTAGQQFSKDKLIEHVLKPSAEIAQGFQSTWFELKDGTVVEGFVSARDVRAIELRGIAGTVQNVPTETVVKEGVRSHSMMPEGLVNALTVHEFASLITFLESLK
jgi:putative heme-binding domain-containing protein